MAVPYPGQPPGIMDLIANRVQFKVASIGLVAQHINSGALKPLAVLGGHSDWVHDVTWSPDGGTLASGAGAQDGTVRYWQPA